MSDSGQLIKGNNLALSSNYNNTDLREYTSIFNDVDSELEEGLELNYVKYNESIKILPGTNAFTTGSVMTPFIQININDTKFIDSGAFSFNSPIYADKVYYKELLNNNTEKTLLCTWLSGSPGGNSKIWVDRYYYPNLISKRQALLSTPAFVPTYSSYLEQLITTNSTLSSEISISKTFDKKSDMVFKPNTRYVYERFDIDSVDFSNLNIYGNSGDNYHTDINQNGGFTLKCTLISQLTTTYRTIVSKFNDISGYFSISYNNNQLLLIISLYDQSTNSYNIIERSYPLIENIDNNVILHVDSTRGKIKFYINGKAVYDNTFLPLYYKLLYGDFYAGEQKITEFVDYLDDVFLSISPLSPDDIEILSIKDTFNYAEEFNITLPCGMRNDTDSVSLINSFTTNQKSKSNTVNVNISNLNITDDDIINGIKNIIQQNATELVSINTNINQINIIT
jgi:hypothetical protein